MKLDIVADSQAELVELYYRMVLVRKFEERLLALFDAKQLTGTTHTYIGQEATAVAASRFLRRGDCVFSQHRSHGYFLAAGGDPHALFLEIIGDRGGVCRGVGGSQHLLTENFLSNGILGGTAGIAVGAALAGKLRGGSDVVVSFLGDGTLGEGLAYESFNIASLWRVPIIFVIENNRYAQTTPIELNLAGDIARRTEAFGIATDEIESNDVVALSGRFKTAFEHVRGGSGPYCLIVHTYRQGPHSKGDDFRPDEERQFWRKRDPLRIAERTLGPAAAAIERRADADAAKATRMPEQVTPLPLAELNTDRDLLPKQFEAQDGWRSGGAGDWLVKHLQEVFARILETRPDVYLLGEDILDPYGGAFKVYRGLSTRFPDRVLTMPVSEAGMIAAANGLALRGFRPVAEVMFGDFATLALDQILNHAAKFGRFTDSQRGTPIVLRMPSGGYRGYGPTHSQSLEKLFLGIPGLVVTASDIVHDPLLIWERMLGLSAPCVHVENKTLYSSVLPEITDSRLGRFYLSSSRGYFPTTTLSLTERNGANDVAIVAYGGMTGMAMEAAERLFVEYEIHATVVVPSQLAPLPVEDLAAAVARAQSVVVLEEGTERAGFGAEVIAALSSLDLLKSKRVRRCAAFDTIIPGSASLERDVLPSVERLIATVMDACK